jgi:thymidylate kinase
LTIDEFEGQFVKLKNVTAFAIEGPDKVGKATQSNLLVHALMDFSTLRTNLIEIPSRHHTCHGKIYDMLKRRPNGTAPAVEHPEIFQTFQVANRFHVQEDIERMAKDGNIIIIFDRWAMSSWAYGLASNVKPSQLETISEGLLEPDVTFVLEGRSFDRPEQENDAYEDDNNFQSKVRKTYSQLASANKNVIRINADRHKNVVHEDIFMVVKRHLIEGGLL